ncbi:hypothetical protein RF55_10773 [Lasius niger]|uniref:Uncharacterized protein n=1 Tax=Lasius niger TaxID=67767 RepID=A0A0J7KH76_LASNI|nr:hypothetical protein RF55_10773 [Lasius niger]
MTGGDPAPVQQNDPVMEFMDATNSNIDVEIDCPYDSTAVFEKENNVETVGTSTIKKRLLISDDDENDDNIIESHMPDHS